LGSGGSGKQMNGCAGVSKMRQASEQMYGVERDGTAEVWWGVRAQPLRPPTDRAPDKKGRRHDQGSSAASPLSRVPPPAFVSERAREESRRAMRASFLALTLHSKHATQNEKSKEKEEAQKRREKWPTKRGQSEERFRVYGLGIRV